jgi:Cdc6-like AAA superfamily ATPase
MQVSSRVYADDTLSVVLMDELDQLLTAKQDVVYNFFNWPTMRDSQLFVIAVANRMDLPQHLAAKIKSRLGEARSSVSSLSS